jgi:hypothetical protein
VENMKKAHLTVRIDKDLYDRVIELRKPKTEIVTDALKLYLERNTICNTESEPVCVTERNTPDIVLNSPAIVELARTIGRIEVFTAQIPKIEKRIKRIEHEMNSRISKIEHKLDSTYSVDEILRCGWLGKIVLKRLKKRGMNIRGQ